jgi:hypothetical protein
LLSFGEGFGGVLQFLGFFRDLVFSISCLAALEHFFKRKLEKKTTGMLE